VEIPSDEEFLACIRCGLCLAVCPTYRESLNETESPRGRVALVRKALEGEMELSSNLVEQTYQCLGCLACNDICPSGVSPADLCMATRFLDNQVKSQSPVKNFLFKTFFTSPKLMELSILPFKLYQRLGLQKLVHKLGIPRLFPSQLRDLERELPELPKKSLHRTLPAVTPAKGTLKHKVGYFLGCFQSLIFADTGAASVRVMAENGCQVITPQDVKCCGMPNIGYGYVETARDLARHNIDLFECQDVDVIVTDCSTCGSTLKEYGELLADDPAYAEKAENFGQRVRDISEFLMEIDLREPEQKLDLKVTYHDPCHVVRAQGLRHQPRDVVQLAGAELVEMKESDSCCGAAGTQLFTHYDMAVAILDRKMKNAAETEAQVIVTGCPGCTLQLGLGTQRHDMDVKVLHPVQLLDMAYRNSQSEEEEDQSRRANHD
jgi:glycolate oxidase iron-sulfur subunit